MDSKPGIRPLGTYSILHAGQDTVIVLDPRENEVGTHGAVAHHHTAAMKVDETWLGRRRRDGVVLAVEDCHFNLITVVARYFEHLKCDSPGADEILDLVHKVSAYMACLLGWGTGG